MCLLIQLRNSFGNGERADKGIGQVPSGIEYFSTCGIHLEFNAYDRGFLRFLLSQIDEAAKVQKSGSNKQRDGRSSAEIGKGLRCPERRGISWVPPRSGC